MPLRPALTLAAALAAAAGCTTNQSGDFAASKTGDLSHPLAERRAPDEELRAACGDGAPLSGFELDLARTPYLQQLGASGTRVLWTGQSALPRSVRVGPAGGSEMLASGVLATAEVDDAAPAGGMAEYEAVIAGLQPDSIYCYSLFHDEQPILAPAGFRTAPAAGSGVKVSFAAFGDSGAGGADQMAVLDQLGTVPFRLMIHTGDIAYESGTLAQYEDRYFAVYADLLRSFAMFPAIGNHDDGSVFQQVFDLPLAERGHNWYSFDHGDVHFVALDTNEIGAEQAAWLDDDLTANQLPWVVVYGHHPPYSSGEHGSTTAFRQQFGPILERHRVDLVLSGHDHDYERVAPQNGVHYVVTGGGGRGTRPVGTSDFTDFSEAVLHFLYVEVEGDQLLLHAIDGEGTEFDQLLIQH
jgi:acid phosphatase type 7